MELGTFDRGRKEILEQGLGDGICSIALHIIKQEFERLRRIESLNLPLDEWNTTGKVDSSNLHGIYEEMSESAPNIVRTLCAFCESSKHGETGREAEARATQFNKAEGCLVMVLGALANFRNNQTNYIQKVFGLFLFASKAPKRVINCLNHLGVSTSYQTVLRDLEKAANRAKSRQWKIASTRKAFIAVFDNLTFLANVRDVRPDNQSGFMTMTAGYILIPPAS